MTAEDVAAAPVPAPRSRTAVRTALSLRPRPTDVVAAVQALDPLAGVPDDDPRWQALAGPTARTAAATLEHLAAGVMAAVGQVARRAEGPLPVLGACAGPPSVQLATLRTGSDVLCALLHDLGRARAWHPAGMADGGGWTGIAVTEALVHGYDVSLAVGVTVQLPDALCARTLTRVFPWVRPGQLPPGRALLAVTGRGHEPSVAADPWWDWQAPPLVHWSGGPVSRAPGRSAGGPGGRPPQR